MSENCDKCCGSCNEDCADRKEEKTEFIEKPHELSSIKKVIVGASGNARLAVEKYGK